jgi:clan AA aspartic protease (TIGR02281 family)
MVGRWRAMGLAAAIALCIAGQTVRAAGDTEILTFDKGGMYIGAVRGGKPNGFGTYKFTSGQKYQGEFVEGKYHGRGTLSFANGDQYVGDFRNDQRDGNGSYIYANGEKFVGQYHDGKRNGAGTLYGPSGAILARSTWVDGVIAGRAPGPTQPRPAPPVMASVTPTAPVPAAASPAGRSEIGVKRRAGTFAVPVEINNVMTLDFTIDSGAADVSVPNKVVAQLLRSGALRRSDFAGTQDYRLADGSTMTSRTFRLRQLKVGDRVVENVLASEGGETGSLLLGQSFLSRFKSWSINNHKQVLVLE